MTQDQTTHHYRFNPYSESDPIADARDIHIYLQRLADLPAEIDPASGVLWHSSHTRPTNHSGTARSTARIRWRNADATKMLCRAWRDMGIVPLMYVHPGSYYADYGTEAWAEVLKRLKQAREEIHPDMGLYCDGKPYLGEQEHRPPTWHDYQRSEELIDWTRSEFPGVFISVHDSSMPPLFPFHGKVDFLSTGEGFGVPWSWGFQAREISADDPMYQYAAEHARRCVAPVTLLGSKLAYTLRHPETTKGQERKTVVEKQTLTSAALGCSVLVLSRHMGETDYESGPLYQRVAEIRRNGN